MVNSSFKQMLILLSFSSFLLLQGETTTAGAVTKAQYAEQVLAKIEQGFISKLKKELDNWQSNLDERLKKEGTDEETASMLQQLLPRLEKEKMNKSVVKHINSSLEEINDELKKFSELSEKIKTWEDNLTLDISGSGVQNRLQMAEAFAKERHFRRSLQNSLQDIPPKLETIMQLMKVQAAQEQARQLMIRNLMTEVGKLIVQSREEMEDLPDASAETNEGGLLSEIDTLRNTQGRSINNVLGEFEIYEVKFSADYREISALPEVYGDPEQWKRLYKANKDKFSDQFTKIPAGTLLKVPNINN